MTVTLTAFERSPDHGQGLARDTRVEEGALVLFEWGAIVFHIAGATQVCCQTM